MRKRCALRDRDSRTPVGYVRATPSCGSVSCRSVHVLQHSPPDRHNDEVPDTGHSCEPADGSRPGPPPPCAAERVVVRAVAEQYVRRDLGGVKPQSARPCSHRRRGETRPSLCGTRSPLVTRPTATSSDPAAPVAPGSVIERPGPGRVAASRASDGNVPGSVRVRGQLVDREARPRSRAGRGGTVLLAVRGHHLVDVGVAITATGGRLGAAFAGRRSPCPPAPPAGTAAATGPALAGRRGEVRSTSATTSTPSPTTWPRPRTCRRPRVWSPRRRRVVTGRGRRPRRRRAAGRSVDGADASWRGRRRARQRRHRVHGRTADPRAAFRDQLDVNLVGVWNTVQAAAPLMIDRARRGDRAHQLGLRADRTRRGRHGRQRRLRREQARCGRADADLRHLARPARHPRELREPDRRRDAHGAQPGGRGALRRRRRSGADPKPVDDVANLSTCRCVQVEDVTAAVAFLASDEARYITGVALPVDAGMLVRSLPTGLRTMTGLLVEVVGMPSSSLCGQQRVRVARSDRRPSCAASATPASRAIP